MKTAEDWAFHNWYGKIHTEEDAIALVEAIQLDAWKQGMTDAEEVVTSKRELLEDNRDIVGRASQLTTDFASKAILTARDAKTTV